jgi:hypothetical protein
MSFFDEYERHYCPIHKITIIYFKEHKAFRGFHCWDCIRESNNKKGKVNERAEQEADGGPEEDFREDSRGHAGAF